MLYFENKLMYLNILKYIKYKNIPNMLCEIVSKYFDNYLQTYIKSTYTCEYFE